MWPLSKKPLSMHTWTSNRRPQCIVEVHYAKQAILRCPVPNENILEDSLLHSRPTLWHEPLGMYDCDNKSWKAMCVVDDNRIEIGLTCVCFIMRIVQANSRLVGHSVDSLSFGCEADFSIVTHR
jgi:hypothetical protein